MAKSMLTYLLPCFLLRRWLMPVAWVLASGCAALQPRAECPVHGGAPWREVESAHFLVRTNLGSAAARQATLQLEQWRAAVRLWWGEDFDPPGRVDVILLRSPREFWEFSDTRYTGVATTRHLRPLLFMATQEGRLIEPALMRHELAHYLSRFVLLRQPRWLAEGLAGYLESVALRGDGTVELGEMDDAAVRAVNLRGTLPLRALWGWDEQPPTTPQETHELYRASWAWVHYLMNMHAERFGEFQRRLARAQEPRQAWEAAFSGEQEESLMRGLRAYYMDSRYTLVTRQLPPVPTQLDERRLEDGQVHALRAWLLSHNWRRLPDADSRQRVEQELSAALSLDPLNVDATLLQLQLLARPHERLERARALVAVKPESMRAWKLLGDALVSDQRQREQAYRNALRLSPEDPEVLVALARTYLEGGRPSNALAMATRAVRMAPWASQPLLTLARVASQLGLCEEAFTAQQRAMDVMPDGASEEYRRTLRQQLGMYRTQCVPSRSKEP